ncbi:hypothetical protein [Nostoc sp.]|uniref:hypothetical protein n=1 Tax=Nostoc sp. TaxID=1180 RepID=UPI002FF845D2
MKLLNSVSSHLLSLSGLLLLGMTATPPAQAIPSSRCSSGTVCIYLGNLLSNRFPINRYYRYGNYPPSNNNTFAKIRA